MYIFTFLICEMNCNILLSIEMDSFSNPNGVKIGNKVCQLGKDNKCVTSFRFCITSFEEESKCISEFQTQIIGENSINQEQFKLTTESIQFPLGSFQIKNNLILLVEVLNNDIESPTKISFKYSKSLISRWRFNLFDKIQLKNKWIKLYDSNSEINQKISLSLKIECFLNYYGNHCEKRKPLRIKNNHKFYIFNYLIFNSNMSKWL